MSLIQLNNFSKKYGRNNVFEKANISIERQTITGVLGKNGSGKTVLLKLLSKQADLSKGKYNINIPEGFDAVEKMTYLSDSLSAWKDYSIKSYFRTCSSFFSNWNALLAKELLEKCEIGLRSKMSTLSPGKESAIRFITGLCTNTAIVLIDEPARGMDVMKQNVLIDALLEINEESETAFILTTNQPSVFENCLTNLAIISNKKINNISITEANEKCFSIKSNKPLEQSILRNKSIIHADKIGHYYSYYIFDTLSQEDLANLQNENTQVSNYKISQLDALMQAKEQS